MDVALGISGGTGASADAAVSVVEHAWVGRALSETNLFKVFFTFTLPDLCGIVNTIHRACQLAADAFAVILLKQAHKHRERPQQGNRHI